MEYKRNIKAYQETNKEIVRNEELKKRKPTPQPKELDEMDY